MKHLRCAALLLIAGAGSPALLRAADEPQPTVIECAGLTEMVSTPTETTFTLHDQVVVTGNNLRLTCDLLVVVAKRTGDPKATFAKQENFKSLVATGRVRILQNDREATCDRAEVLPGDDKVILHDHVIVRSLDNRFIQTGGKATLYRGELRAVIEGPPGEPTRLTLPPLKDLGPGKDKKTSPTDEAAPKVTAPK